MTDSVWGNFVWGDGTLFEADTKPKYQARKTMSKADRTVKSLPIPDRITKGRQFVATCTGKPAYAVLQSDLAKVGTATDQLEADYNAAQELKKQATAATVTQNRTADAWNAAMEDAFLELDKLAGGDPSIINNAGVGATGSGNTPNAGMLGLCDPVKLVLGTSSGEMVVSWSRVAGTVSYLVQYSTTPEVEASWQTGGVATKAKLLVKGLTARTKYAFRVAAVATAGQGPWSNVVEKFTN